jgi:hypothetical protein
MPECGMPITYEYIQFHHIGRAHCDYCGYTMPDPTLCGSDFEDYASYRVTDRIRNQNEISAINQKTCLKFQYALNYRCLS